VKKLKPILDIAPTVDLITLDEAKAHIRRDDDDDNYYILSLISIVMSHLDGATGILSRALLEQTWTEKANGFPPCKEFRFLLSPLISVETVTYYDSYNVLQTYPPSNYKSYNGYEYAYLKLNRDATWPTTYNRDDAITITAKFGYGVDKTSVPQAIKHAGLMLLSHWYENREAVMVGAAVSELPAGVMRLLRPYIRPHF
jgi:uncharacterized phiE125 gp8 family phage protein